MRQQEGIPCGPIRATRNPPDRDGAVSMPVKIAKFARNACVGNTWRQMDSDQTLGLENYAPPSRQWMGAIET
jgi:hypothetical protein